jgi:hypothetical protein
MHKNEPSLLSHVTEVRKKLSSQEGGISVVIYCGRVHNEGLMAEALAVHRKVTHPILFPSKISVFPFFYLRLWKMK